MSSFSHAAQTSPFTSSWTRRVRSGIGTARRFVDSRISAMRYALLPPDKRFYSQRGEDQVLKKLFPQESGFYVDVGAYDPVTFSNTAHFYGIGWRGINIEPSPVNFRNFLTRRPGDVNLNVGIADRHSSLSFYRMHPDTLSTFNQESAREYSQFPNHRIVQTIDIPVVRLQDVFREHASKRDIHFLSIDTEGFEREVLEGNSWNEFRPIAILIEYRDYHPSGTHSHSADAWEPLLLQAGYRLAFLNYLNAIYVREESRELLQRLSGTGTGYTTVREGAAHIQPL